MPEQSESNNQNEKITLTEKELKDARAFIVAKKDKNPEDFASYKIYLLKRIFAPGYDEYDGKVIIASSVKAARKIANLKYADEGPIWEDNKQVLCREIPLTMPLVVLESFNAG